MAIIAGVEVGQNALERAFELFVAQGIRLKNGQLPVGIMVGYINLASEREVVLQPQSLLPPPSSNKLVPLIRSLPMSPGRDGIIKDRPVKVDLRDLTLESLPGSRGIVEFQARIYTDENEQLVVKSESSTKYCALPLPESVPLSQEGALHCWLEEQQRKLRLVGDMNKSQRSYAELNINSFLSSPVLIARWLKEEVDKGNGIKVSGSALAQA